jgi:hypothetical protein
MSDNPCDYHEPYEVFANIGFLVCEFANFEGYLAPALALMLNDNGDQASVILGQIDSFSYKWGTVVGVAETLKGKSKVADAVLEIDADVRAANTFRNKLAHGGNRVEGTEVWLIVNANSTKRGPPRGEQITGPAVQAQIDTIRAAMDRMQAVIDWNRLTGETGLMRALRYTPGRASPDR